MNILMIDMIFEYFALIVIFLLSMYLYVMLVARILPKIFLVPGLGAVKGDRGIKKSVFPGGRSVAYEPKLSIRKYISQYELFSENGEKYIKCKINEKIKSLKYDVVVYDRKNTPIGTVEISETVQGGGYTAEVMLPPETSFVHLRLRSVNDVPVAENEESEYYGSGVLAFFLIAFGLSFAEGAYLNYVVLKLFDLIFSFSASVTEFDASLPLVVAAAVGALFSALIIVVNVEKPCKIVWHKKK